METFSVLLAICAGNSPVPGEFPTQRPVTRSFDVSLICVWINGWVNNREAGDLRRYRAHYDVSVMDHFCFWLSTIWIQNVWVKFNSIRMKYPINENILNISAPGRCVLDANCQSYWPSQSVHLAQRITHLRAKIFSNNTWSPYQHQTLIWSSVVYIIFKQKNDYE